MSETNKGKQVDPKKGERKTQKNVTETTKKEKKKKKNQQLKKPKKPVEPIVLTTTEQEKFDRIISVGEECQKEEELKALLRSGKQPICYDGFEPSGRIHIAQGIMKAINVNKLTKSGCKFIFLVADWFAMMNNKMGGDLKKIKIVGEYMIEVWKAAGMDLTNVEFLRSSDIINDESDKYWLLVLDIARKFNLARIVRCSQIMGRNDKDDLSAAQIFYPCMQCADIFFLNADICQLGLDQRKVNMLAREYCDVSKPKRRFKPIILSHHMLSGLKGGDKKMSKSDPDNAIFMNDNENQVRSKIKKAYCAPGDIKSNPPLEYIKYIVFPSINEFILFRKEKDGGNKVYKSYDDLEKEFAEEKIHPGDLKPSLAKAINKLLDPVRLHFKNDKRANQLLRQVKKFKITK